MNVKISSDTAETMNFIVRNHGQWDDGIRVRWTTHGRGGQASVVTAAMLVRGASGVEQAAKRKQFFVSVGLSRAPCLLDDDVEQMGRGWALWTHHRQASLSPTAANHHEHISRSHSLRSNDLDREKKDDGETGFDHGRLGGCGTATCRQQTL